MLPPSRRPSLLRSRWSAAKEVIIITGDDGDDGTGHVLMVKLKKMRKARNKLQNY